MGIDIVLCDVPCCGCFTTRRELHNWVFVISNYSYFCSKVNFWNVNCAQATSYSWYWNNHHSGLYIYIIYIYIYNTSPPRMFLSLDLLWEYRIQHGANGPLYVTSNYSTWIFCRGVSGFATDCPCSVWCRGLTTCLLHVGPPFENRIWNNRHNG